MRKDDGMYPVRSKQHVSETQGLAILQEKLPPSWILRSLTERDYGIDFVVEISRGEQMIGDMIVAQVKSVSKRSFSGSKAAYRGLRSETLNYLLGQPAPAYLFVVSLEDGNVHWASLREHERVSVEVSRSPPVMLHQGLDLSQTGKLALQLSQLKEKVWPEVERAVMAALMFYNALGPLYLACKRLPEQSSIPSSVQQLIVSHFEYNTLIQRYILSSSKKYRHLPEYYDQAMSEGAITGKMTFTAGFAVRFLDEFIGDYLRAIEVCDRMVRVVQRPYWYRRHVYRIAHMDAFPPYFVIEDWYARYFWDEYENETDHINLSFFSDIDAGVRHDFQPFMN